MKRKLLIAIVIILTINNAISQNVGIGTATPHPSARLEIYSQSRGLLIPRLTTAQRDSIANPAHALMIFNIDSFCLEVYNADSMRWYKLSCPVQCPPCGTNNCTPPSCNINILGPDTVCRGDTVLFVAQGCPNVSWRLPSGWVPIGSLTSDSITVVVDTVGTDTLVAQSCNGCGCVSSSKVVIVNSCMAFCIATANNSNATAAYDIIQTADGGYVGTGVTNFVTNGGFDLWVFKLDSSGNSLWDKVIGSTNNDRGLSILELNDGTIIAIGYARFSSYNEAFVVKLNSSGQILWTKTYSIPSSHFTVNKSTLIGNDTILIAGYGRVGPFSYAGVFDFIVLMIDTSGNVLDLISYGDTLLTDERAIKAIKTHDGYVIVGEHRLSSNIDIMVIKTDNSGTILWSKLYGGTSDDYPKDVVELPDGSLIVVGHTLSFGQGLQDIYVLKISSNGNLIWTRTIGTGDYDEGYSVQYHNNKIYIGGYLTVPGNNSDMAIIELDTAGNVLNTVTIGSPQREKGYTMRLTTYGGAVIVGYRQNTGVYQKGVVAKLDHQFSNRCTTGCVLGTGGSLSSGGSENNIYVTQYSGTASVTSNGNALMSLTFNRECP